MRELTFDECNMVAGAGRFGAFFKFLRDVIANAAGSLLAAMATEDDQPDQPEAPPVTFDPTPNGPGISNSGHAAGAQGFGSFWTDNNGFTWFDFTGDGVPESRQYTSDDGTTWEDNMDNNWHAVAGPAI